MAEPAARRSPEPVTSGELAMALADIKVLTGTERPVMFRVRGEVLPCTRATLEFHEDRYVLMLDGEGSD